MQVSGEWVVFQVVENLKGYFRHTYNINRETFFQLKQIFGLTNFYKIILRANM